MICKSNTIFQCFELDCFMYMFSREFNVRFLLRTAISVNYLFAVPLLLLYFKRNNKLIDTDC